MELNRDQLLKHANQEKEHDRDWWMQPERKKLLKKVFMEDSDSSEDEFGQPKYIREKDENYLADIKEIERKHLEYERERQKIIKENERRKREGNSQQLRVPPANEALRSKEKKTY